MSLFNRSKSNSEQNSTSSSSTVNNVSTVDSSQTQALQDVANSIIAGGNLTQYNTNTDYGAINKAIEGMETLGGNALLSNVSVAENALASNTNVSGAAMNVANNSLLSMLASQDSAFDTVDKVANNSLVAMLASQNSAFDTVDKVASNALLANAGLQSDAIAGNQAVLTRSLDTVDATVEQSTSLLGGIFGEALDFASNAMSTAAHAARSESAQIMSEITSGQVDKTKMAAIGLTVVGVAFAISRIWR